MEESDFKELKKWLAKGDVKRLAEKHGISRQYASLILSGKRKNFSFLSEAINGAMENKRKITEAARNLKQMTA